MKFISVQPDNDYFIWQCQVQMNNFRKLGIEKDAILIFGVDKRNGASQNVINFSRSTKAITIFIPDDRTNEDLKYIPTIRPYLLKQFFKYHTKLMKDHDVLYHDSDILFAKLPDFKKLAKKKKLLVSDTISYIGAEYIKSKGEGLLEEMCNVVGIDPKLVIKNEKNSGGAQYFFPKIMPMTYEFWDKIQKDSLELYNVMLSTSHKYTPSHPIQAWTADMWAILWNVWLMGGESLIVKEMEFSWPTFPIAEWDKYNIFHNAGVTPDRTDLFFKGKYNLTSPFNVSHDEISKEFCSYKYVEEILETAKLLNPNQ